MNTYETVFIASPVLAETALAEIVSKFQGLLTENGATVEHTEQWGLKKLAYPIQKKSTGYYFLMQFSAPDGVLIDALETAYRRDERIVRFLTFRMDKDSMAYAEKRRTKINTKN